MKSEDGIEGGNAARRNDLRRDEIQGDTRGTRAAAEQTPQALEYVKCHRRRESGAAQAPLTSGGAGLLCEKK